MSTLGFASLLFTVNLCAELSALCTLSQDVDSIFS